MMKIRLIRHGMTRPGEEHRYQGALDEGLSEGGRAALRRADCNPARVYVSPARRAVETAGILFPDSKQILVPDLREMNFGDFEGKTWKEMENDARYRDWVDGGCLGTCPGGESRASFSDRVCGAFLSVLSREMDLSGHLTPEDEAHRPEACAGDIYIVAHGGTQMAVLDRWGRPARDYYSWQRPCGCGWLLEARFPAGIPAGPELLVLQELSFV